MQTNSVRVIEHLRDRWFGLKQTKIQSFQWHSHAEQLRILVLASSCPSRARLSLLACWNIIIVICFLRWSTKKLLVIDLELKLTSNNLRPQKPSWSHFHDNSLSFSFDKLCWGQNFQWFVKIAISRDVKTLKSKFDWFPGKPFLVCALLISPITKRLWVLCNLIFF